MAGTASADDRRTAIADAAIEVLATVGSKGLTHRAVDRHLGLSPGSTSYYHRTRDALLRAAEQRLAALDLADVEAARADPAGVAALVQRWLAPRRRARLVARFELFLHEARHPDEGVLGASRRAFADRVEHAMAAAGAPDPPTAAAALVASVEGLLLNGLIGPRLTNAQRTRIIDAALTAALTI